MTVLENFYDENQEIMENLTKENEKKLANQKEMFMEKVQSGVEQITKLTLELQRVKEEDLEKTNELVELHKKHDEVTA